MKPHVLRVDSHTELGPPAHIHVYNSVYSYKKENIPKKGIKFPLKSLYR